MSLEEGIELQITDVRWKADHVLELRFSDGAERELDFEPFLCASVHPEIRKYLNVKRFKAFSINGGNLVWNNYDLCFSIEDLYDGSLLSGHGAQSMVAEDSPDYGSATGMDEVDSKGDK